MADDTPKPRSFQEQFGTAPPPASTDGKPPPAAQPETPTAPKKFSERFPVEKPPPGPGDYQKGDPLPVTLPSKKSDTSPPGDFHSGAEINWDRVNDAWKRGFLTSPDVIGQGGMIWLDAQAGSKWGMIPGVIASTAARGANNLVRTLGGGFQAGQELLSQAVEPIGQAIPSVQLPLVKIPGTNMQFEGNLGGGPGLGRDAAAALEIYPAARREQKIVKPGIDIRNTERADAAIQAEAEARAAEIAKQEGTAPITPNTLGVPTRMDPILQSQSVPPGPPGPGPAPGPAGAPAPQPNVSAPPLGMPPQPPEGVTPGSPLHQIIEAINADEMAQRAGTSANAPITPGNLGAPAPMTPINSPGRVPIQPLNPPAFVPPGSNPPSLPRILELIRADQAMAANKPNFLPPSSITDEHGNVYPIRQPPNPLVRQPAPPPPPGEPLLSTQAPGKPVPGTPVGPGPNVSGTSPAPPNPTVLPKGAKVTADLQSEATQAAVSFMVGAVLDSAATGGVMAGLNMIRRKYGPQIAGLVWDGVKAGARNPLVTASTLGHTDTRDRMPSNQLAPLLGNF